MAVAVQTGNNKIGFLLRQLFCAVQFRKRGISPILPKGAMDALLKDQLHNLRRELALHLKGASRRTKEF